MIRLVLVEARRAVDTRASRWAFVIAATFGVLLGYLSPDGVAKTFKESVAGVSLALPILMALLAVMAFTSDWGTRAVLTTFALTPRRQRVLAARYVAVVLLAIATLIAIHVLAAVVFIIARPGETSSVLDGAVLAQFWQMLATTIAASLTAMAVAGLVLRTSLALLITVFGPMVLTIGLAFTPRILDWLNPYGFASWFADPTWAWTVPSDTAVGLGPALSSFLLWTATPLVLGLYRQLRAEPR